MTEKQTIWALTTERKLLEVRYQRGILKGQKGSNGRRLME